MPRTSEPRVRVHILLSQRDLDRIEAAFPATKIGRSEAIRLMIGAMLDNIDAEVEQKSGPAPTVRLSIHREPVE